MICPDEGRLLLYLEGALEPEENQAMMTHLASCSHCLQRLNQVEDHLLFANHKLACLSQTREGAVPPDQSRIWENIKSHSINRRKEQRGVRIKKAAMAAVIVISLGFIGSIPSVQSAAANFLQVFRMQEVDTITIGPNDMAQIERALSQGGETINVENFGSIRAVGESEERVLAEDELSQLGFDVKLPAQMEGSAAYSLQKMPVIEVRPKVENVNKLLASLGSEYELPMALDGQLCRIVMGDSLIVRYPDLLLYEGPSPQIEVPAGVSVEKVAQAMVALPIWPDNVRRQLEAVNDWEHTLLIPSSEKGQKVKVNGNNAVLLNEAGHKALIWQENGTLYMLEEQSDKRLDLVAAAESLR